MANPLSYTPARWLTAPQGRRDVARRHLIYLPGYDPEAKTRARSLFVRELVRYARRFGLSDRTVSRVEDRPEVPGLRWHVRAARDGWATETIVEVLRWDDIVDRDFKRSVATRIGLMLVGMVDYLFSGVLVRLFRMNWKFACVIIYPFTMITALGLVAAGLGYAAARVGALLLPAQLPEFVPALLGIAVAAALVAAIWPFFDRLYVWHLLHDWVFNWQHGNGVRRDYEERVDRFAAHLADLARTSDADEILVLGHSSGSIMAVETVARALALDPDLGRVGPELSLLTVGSCLPLVAFNPRAETCRRDLARIMTSEAVHWVEYQAPQDLLNSAAFNPMRDLDLGIAEAACANPAIRSSRFRDITTEATYRTMLKSPFRMHFQFLMANEKPGDYDYILMALGPTRLADRVRRPDEANALALGMGLGMEEATTRIAS